MTKYVTITVDGGPLDGARLEFLGETVRKAQSTLAEVELDHENASGVYYFPANQPLKAVYLRSQL